MKAKLYKKDLKKRHSQKIFQKAGKYCWETPQDFFDKLHREFNFTIDVCANKENNKLDIYYSEEDNALEKDWGGNVCWMNPPYGREISKWVKKAFEESKRGTTVVCLIPSRTETKWWWNYCMKGEIRFIKGRLKFKGRNTKGELVNYPATFGCAVVIFKGIDLNQGVGE
jgi:phage N-6-adenine-methyltransferase